MEEVAEQHSVLVRLPSPHLPELLIKRILHEMPAVNIVQNLVFTVHVRWQSVNIIVSAQGLRR